LPFIAEPPQEASRANSPFTAERPQDEQGEFRLVCSREEPVVMGRDADPHGVQRREAFVQAEDGALVYYRWRGSGPTILLCDGIGCEGFAWRFLEPVLAAHHQVVHFHNRGHGRSPAPPDPARVSIEVLADDAAAVLSALDAESAILLGHSMGVQTCLEVYRRHRARVRGLVLTCGSYGSPLRTLYGTDLAHHLLPLMQLALKGTRRPLRLLWRAVLPTELAFRVAVRLEVNGELIERVDMVEYLRHLARVEPELFLRMLAYAEEHSAGDLLERIAVPTLLVGGEHDGFTPIGLAREMRARIPGAELLEVSGGTHAAPLERPELVTPAVEEFVLTVDADRLASGSKALHCEAKTE